MNYHDRLWSYNHGKTWSVMLCYMAPRFFIVNLNAMVDHGILPMKGHHG